MELAQAIQADPALAYTVPVDSLDRLLREAAHAYYNAEPFMSDAAFDHVQDVLRERAPNAPALAEVGASVTGAAVRLPYAMFSLSKVKPGGDLGRWAARQAGPFVLTDKLDGTSAMVVYTRAPGGPWRRAFYRRGNGELAADISHLADSLLPAALRQRPPPGVQGDAVAVRGEIVMPRAAFQSGFAAEFKDARSLVNSLVNRKALDAKARRALAATRFVAYELVHPRLAKRSQLLLLRDAGFDVVTAAEVADVSDEVLAAYYAQRRGVASSERASEYAIDGIVVESDGPHAHEGSGNPGYAVAFKMPLDSQGAETRVLDVVYEASKDGRLVPRLHYEPVLVNGVTLQWATGFNARFVAENRLGPGARIFVIRSGDVIPFVARVLAPAPEAKLPEGAWDWDANGVHAVLARPNDDPGVRVKRLVKLFTDLGVDNLKQGLVERFYEHGMTRLSDYLDADAAKFLTLPGVSTTLAAKLHANVQSRLKDADPVGVMTASGAFGSGVGSRRLTVLLQAMPDLLTSALPRAELVRAICEVDGFQETTAQRVADGLVAFREFMAQHPQITLARPARAAPAPPADSPLLGATVVFTGFRNQDWERAVVAAGGRVSTSVSAKTSLLVARDPDSDSGKVQKARQLGVRVVGEAQFEAEFEAELA